MNEHKKRLNWMGFIWMGYFALFFVVMLGDAIKGGDFMMIIPLATVALAMVYVSMCFKE